MITARRTSFAIAALFLAVMAGAGESAAAANDRALRQLRATIHDMFSPPRRTRRAKGKAARPAETSGSRTETPAAGSRPRAAQPVDPVPEPRPRPEAAKPRPERMAKLPAAEEPPPATREEPARASGRRERVARLPATKQTQPEPATKTPPASAAKTPPDRPERTAALPPAARSQDEVEVTEPAPPGPSPCQLRLTPDLAAVQLLPSVSAGQCTVGDVVRLEAVMAKDGRRIALNPAATLRCPMAETVVHWIRDELAPAASDLGAALKAIAVDTSFECRSRNRVKGAKLSEHGHANAIDVRAITLANGAVVALTDATVDKAVRERLKQGACAHFTTVLGPGSDGYHESHVHLDRAERRGGYRMCQWDVRDVAEVRPMPRERPAEAPPRTASTGRSGARN